MNPEIAFAIHTEAGVLMLDRDLVCRWVAMTSTTSTLSDAIGARFLAAIRDNAMSLRPEMGSLLVFLHERGGPHAVLTAPVLFVEHFDDDEAPTQRIPFWERDSDSTIRTTDIGVSHAPNW